MTSPRQEVAGHPIAIRVGGRRLSQSQPNLAKSPTKSGLSPDDPLNATAPVAGDYPRPDPTNIRQENNGGGHEDQQQEESSRRKKRGFKTDEAKNMLLNNAGSASGRAPRRNSASANASGGARIQQPNRGMAI
ncbi:unnamed protein product [Sympodiomycopsis kandeliae]